MKKALAVMAIAAISASDPASAANLRAKAPLLQRCRNGASVEECCAPGGHKLYAKKDDGNPGRLGKQCCAKSLGSWLPTNGDDANKFCKLGGRTRAAEKEIDRVKSVSDRMVNAMKGLKKSQSRLKREYRQLYLAHEGVENGKKSDINKDRKELQLLEDQAIAKNAEMTSIQTAISEQEGKTQKTIQGFNDDVRKIDTSISLAESAFDAAQKDYAKKLSLISDLNKALDNCNESNEDTRKAITDLRSSLKWVKLQNGVMEKRQSEAQKDIIKNAGELTKLKKDHEEEITTIGRNQDEIRTDLKQFTEYNDGLIEEINDLQSQITQLNTEKMSVEARTEVKKAKKAAKAAASLLQVKDDGDEGFDANKYANAPLKKDQSSGTWIDTEQKMLDDASSFVTEKLGGLKDVMLNLKAIVSRVKALKNLDADLHAKIMDDLENRHKKLKTNIELMEKAADKLQKSITKAVRKLKILQAKERILIKFQNKQLFAKNAQLRKQLEDLKEMTNLIADAKTKVWAVTAKNVKCKAILLKNKAVKKWVSFDLGRKRQALAELTTKVTTSEERVERLQAGIVAETLAHNVAVDNLEQETSRLEEEKAVAEKMADKLEARRDDKVDERDVEQKDLNHAKDELKRVDRKGRPGKRPGK